MEKTMTRAVLALTCLAIVARADSREIDTGFLDRSVVLAGVTHRFQVYVPADYTQDDAWPVLVDLHGNGAQGDDGIRQTAHFLPEQIRLQRSRFALLVLFPQAAPGTTWQSTAMQDLVIAELDRVLTEFHADERRVYLSGFSMGGAGVYAVAARWPERFAALVAISGYVPADHAEMLARIRRIPLKIFHGERDERVPVDGARRLAAELKKAGAPADYVEYPHARHGPTAETAYADPGVIEWLLLQRRR